MVWKGEIHIRGEDDLHSPLLFSSSRRSLEATASLGARDQVIWSVPWTSVSVFRAGEASGGQDGVLKERQGMKGVTVGAADLSVVARCPWEMVRTCRSRGCLVWEPEGSDHLCLSYSRQAGHWPFEHGLEEGIQELQH